MVLRIGGAAMFRLIRRRLAGVNLLVAAVALAASVTSGTSLAQTGPTVPFVTVAEGHASGVHEPAKLVIRDQAAWLALWGRHRGSATGPIPAVDFGHDMVVAIFGGESREMRQLTIRKIVRDDRLDVWYTLAATRPLPDGEGVTSVVPFHIVRLARSPLPVRFLQVKTPQVY